jgi:hypothetical protein
LFLFFTSNYDVSFYLYSTTFHSCSLKKNNDNNDIDDDDDHDNNNGNDNNDDDDNNNNLLDITMNNGTLPADWKRAIVVPIHKGGD